MDETSPKRFCLTQPLTKTLQIDDDLHRATPFRALAQRLPDAPCMSRPLAMHQQPLAAADRLAIGAGRA